MFLTGPGVDLEYGKVSERETKLRILRVLLSAGLNMNQETSGLAKKQDSGEPINQKDISFYRWNRRPYY